MKKVLRPIWTTIIIILSGHLSAQEIVSPVSTPGAFPLVSGGKVATIVIDPQDFPLIKKAAEMLQHDVEAVTGKKPLIQTSLPTDGQPIITIHSAQQQKWEAYQIKADKNKLTITGSDRRGTAYGVMTLLEQIGVSPWYWFADVPVKKSPNLYVKPGTYSDAPKVKYRGIFINDEAPALSTWVKQNYGDFNHNFYDKVFDLLLRLKGNYFWPAMWGHAFYDDDSLNINKAEEYGIVIGASHHEPLMRAHDEWKRYGKGPWDYDSNAVNLNDFWRKGMQRATNEKIVSIGMRGDGDKPMSRATATALLERIVDTQRHIIEEVTHQPAAKTPQLWALYKEVQDYYDKGMRVPDDVTLLLCDDNWGNIRRLPSLNDRPRSGGYGIYYHFDYVGGPRNYKWINTNNIARVWEQMHLAYEYGVRQIWIVNVGDIKPMEMPISFYLDHAWNPDRFNAGNIRHYYADWAKRQFGPAHATEIGDIVRLYSVYVGRRKPELLDARTYSTTAYKEFERVVEELRQLRDKANKVDAQLPQDQHDAYFQLVLHPILALCNLHEMYQAVALNQQYAAQNNPLANNYAEQAKKFYEKDSLITQQYHHIAGGKWDHMMSQSHIGYMAWFDPPRNRMPKLAYVGDSLSVRNSVTAASTTITRTAFIPDTARGNNFFEKDGVVSIEAEHYSLLSNGKDITWKVIPDIGKTGGAITTFPVTATRQEPKNIYTAYTFYTYDTGAMKLYASFSPTLNFPHGPGLQCAVSIDDQQPQILTLNQEDENVRTWEKWVASNCIIKESTLNISKPGKHLLKYWMMDPGVVLQKLVIDAGGLQQSYLGPPETRK
ncbi:MAG: glycosyl hydrolase 115 family protein [Bacteroidetes bacterium]|nr:glycosyl hydrolase 115 family protein [Bacteroidota bacterium]